MAEKLLTVRQVQTAGEGDHSDGGGLLLRIRGISASWVLRYTAPSGRRREMGLGAVRRANTKEAGESLTGAREAAAKARAQLQAGQDPIDERQKHREAAQRAEAASKAQKKRKELTVARAARDYHERVIEPCLSAKHAAQWIASLENHVPADVWHKPIAEIDAPELLAALAGVRALQGEGERVPETLRRIRQRLNCGVGGCHLPQALHQQPRGRDPSQNARNASREAGRRLQGAGLPRSASVHGAPERGRRHVRPLP